VWLLGLIGALALVLPLAQVLLFQVDALREDRAELARLDPLAEALALQRSLVEHDAVATLVLRGRRGLEGERRLRQDQVDQHVAALLGTLPAELWPLARREADGLQADWQRLAQAVGQRRIDAAISRQRHRLLQEQAVQVMDLVQARREPPGDAPDPARDAEAVAAQVVPAFVAHPASALDARRAQLRERITRHAAARDLAALALATALGLLALAVGRTGTGHERAATAGGTVRQGHGRRATDRASALTPAQLAAAELDAVRRGVEDARSGG
jgi:hypothetical protein